MTRTPLVPIDSSKDVDGTPVPIRRKHRRQHSGGEMRRLSFALLWLAVRGAGISVLVLGANAAAAQDTCKASAPAYRQAFDAALHKSGFATRVKRIDRVTAVEDYGCHLVFELSTGDQIAGTFLMTLMGLMWTSDSKEPSEVERYMMAQTLSAPPPPPKTFDGPSPAPFAPGPAKARPGIDVPKVCGEFARERTFQGAFDALREADESLQTEIRETLQEQAEADAHFAGVNQTPDQIKAHSEKRLANLRHADDLNWLSLQIHVKCPPFINEHHFDGR